MTRIAVLGANGQVGAELCLLLAQQPGVELVPVCRSAMGSSYLRYRGIPCRHGQVADPEQAAGLYGDCDVIVNLVLVGTTTNPAAARAANESILENIARFSRVGARHLYFSTMSVYGDAAQGDRFVIRNSYGQEKLRCEKIALNAGQRHHQETLVFRLGHVCGDLQGITKDIRQALAKGPVKLADPDRYSNTVYVAAIVDAILKSAGDEIEPGIYDLMNVPQWTWRQVFEYEGQRIGLSPQYEIVGDGPSLDFAQSLKGIATKSIMAVAKQTKARRAASRILPLMPQPLYRKIKAAYNVRAAAGDIARLGSTAAPMEAVLRKPLGGNYAEALSASADLLREPSYLLSPEPKQGIWPENLPLYSKEDSLVSATL